MRADFHTHTNFSTDCEASPTEMMDGAVQRGLEVLCVTDHHDKDYKPGSSAFLFDTERYFRVMRELREKYSGRLDIRIGVELGLQPHLGAHYREYVRRYPFDFVIGSVHTIQSMDPYEGVFFDGRTDEEAYAEAFSETLEDIRAIPDFDVLGHLDYVVRYGKGGTQHYSYRRFADIIDEILRYLIQNGKGIELNMAGFKYGLGFGHPHPDVLRRYRELGGELITVGSDAHRPEHLAYDFCKAEEILKSCGFRYYAEFENRRPVMKPLE